MKHPAVGLSLIDFHSLLNTVNSIFDTCAPNIEMISDAIYL